MVLCETIEMHILKILRNKNNAFGKMLVALYTYRDAMTRSAYCDPILIL